MKITILSKQASDTLPSTSRTVNTPLPEGIVDPVKLNPKTGQQERWVSNPVNEAENFADKWALVAQKEEYFYAWLDKLEEDLSAIKYGENKGLHILNESFSAQYGNQVVKRTFAEYGEKNRILREKGNRKMAIGTGLLGSVGKPIPNHNFEGNI